LAEHPDRQFNVMVHDSIEEQAKTLPMYNIPETTPGTRATPESADALKAPIKRVPTKGPLKNSRRTERLGGLQSSSKARSELQEDLCKQQQSGWEQGQNGPHRPDDGDKTDSMANYNHVEAAWRCASSGK
jgi:hypothetical protein